MTRRQPTLLARRWLVGALAVAAMAVGAPARGDWATLRFCENRPDGVVLEIVRQSGDPEAADPSVIVAVPGTARCSLTSPTFGLVRIAGQAELRGVRLVSLAVEQEGPEVLGRAALPVRFQIAFGEAAAGGASPSARPPSPYFEPVFSSLVLNYPFPEAWRAGLAESAATETVPTSVPERYERAVKIEVEPPGWVNISREQLRRATGRRWSPSEARARLRLWREGRPYPFAVPPDSAATETLLGFQATAFASPYTRWDAYWLTWDERTATQSPPSPLPSWPTAVGPSATCRIKRRPVDFGLLHPKSGADLIYVCHPQFVKEIDPLAQWRRRQGLRVAVATSEQIADLFNFGRDEPEAIERFLAWTYAHWPPPAPAFAVLVGDASARPKSDDPAVSRNFISTIYPAHADGLTSSGAEGTEPPAYDDGYVAFAPDGLLPQMMLGRLSVNEPGQLPAIVEKLVAHERRPQIGVWRGRLLLLADNGYEQLFDPTITSSIPTHLDLPRIDVRDFPFVDHYRLEQTKISPACRDAVVSRLDEGAAAVHYVGHGGISLISHEKMFFWTDVARLTNRGRLPFFVQLSCRTGGFDWPEQEWDACLSELLLRRPRGGALGVLAASRAFYGDEAYLQRCLFRAYGAATASQSREHSISLGAVKLAMKVPCLLNHSETDFIASYNLLGDPSSRLFFPAPFARLEVEPSRPLASGETAVRVAGLLPDPRRGRVWLHWRDPLGREHAVPGAFATRNGQFEASVDLPGGGRTIPGAWKLVAYATADWRRPADYQGVATVQVNLPPQTYPNDPAGQGDLAFVSGGFEFLDEDLTEGDTIQVRAVVENRGTRRSEPSRLVWYWQKAGARAESAKEVASAGLPALYPTERHVVSLRWDPYGVVGPINCTLRIVPPVGEKETENNQAERSLGIKTKPDLTLAATPSWRLRGWRLRLGLSVKNLGETAAGDVQVKLALGDETGPQTTLGDPRPVARRLGPLAQSPLQQWTFRLPESKRSQDFLYIEIITAEPVAEIDKRNNRYRLRLASETRSSASK